MYGEGGVAACGAEAKVDDAGLLPQSLSTLFTYLSQDWSLDLKHANLAELAGRHGRPKAPSV